MSSQLFKDLLTSNSEVAWKLCMLLMSTMNIQGSRNEPQQLFKPQNSLFNTSFSFFNTLQHK